MKTIGWVLYDSSCEICSWWALFGGGHWLESGYEPHHFRRNGCETGMPEELLLKEIRVLLIDRNCIRADAYFYCSFGHRLQQSGTQILMQMDPTVDDQRANFVFMHLRDSVSIKGSDVKFPANDRDVPGRCVRNRTTC